MKILLLEDELMLQSSIYEYLDTLGHQVDCFSDGKIAQHNLDSQEYDLLILDINVPNIDGLTLMKNLNVKDTYTPTIFISADVDINTISEAFDLGAIDYLKKPFHLKELGLRIQKEISNIQNNKNIYISLSKNYSFSKEKNILFFNKTPQKLTKKQLLIINCLCSNINTIVDLEMLRYDVWDSEPVSDATIRTEISRLRKILNNDFIQNVKGIGYKIDRYIAPIN